MNKAILLDGLTQTVKNALAEDIGDGDITAQLIPEEKKARATIICREQAVICGRPWVDEVFNQINPSLELDWKVSEGNLVEENQTILAIQGKARDLLTAERSALNFLQTLSGTATQSRHYQSLVNHTKTRILDTRKTIPGLRKAQKYAVAIGGCYNHRLGLYDAFLIKENHINAAGSISQAINLARSLYPDRQVEIEVESIAEFEQALTANADIIMLDNFSLSDLVNAVAINRNRVKLEASGGYDEQSIIAVAETGVDYISIGALTKHCRAIDFSMRFE